MRRWVSFAAIGRGNEREAVARRGVVVVEVKREVVMCRREEDMAKFCLSEEICDVVYLSRRECRGGPGDGGQ